MSADPLTDEANSGSKIVSSEGMRISRSVLLVLLLTLAAIAADQLAAPILYSTSPLWGTLACLLLIWRRGGTSLSSDEIIGSRPLSAARIAAFVAAHIALVLGARALSLELQPVAGALSLWGALFAGLKLSVLLPTLLLLPLAKWRLAAQNYRSEFIAALVVLFTYFPRRAFDSLWPWHGQILGRFVFFLAGLLVPGLGYVSTLTPTLTGRQLDVTILSACSGINGIELFQTLFGLIAVCDWNRLRKGRALFGYFAGLAFMLLGNALRITSLVVLGNHGLSELVSRFHISAGWIFFSLVFLVYLGISYRWMLGKGKNAGSSIPSSEKAEPDGVLRPPKTQTHISKI